MFHVVLFQPEIPPNTGNIIRLCANTGATLHLVKPLGFVWDDRRLRRAGLDYEEWAEVRLHDDFAACRATLGNARMFALTTRATHAVADAHFLPGDAFLFGPETRGLPPEVLAGMADGHCLRIPMQPQSRSMNLANAVAVTIYEAWRQQGFAGAR